MDISQIHITPFWEVTQKEKLFHPRINESLIFHLTSNEKVSRKWYSSVYSSLPFATSMTFLAKSKFWKNTRTTLQLSRTRTTIKWICEKVSACLNSLVEITVEIVRFYYFAPMLLCLNIHSHHTNGFAIEEQTAWPWKNPSIQVKISQTKRCLL